MLGQAPVDSAAFASELIPGLLGHSFYKKFASVMQQPTFPEIPREAESGTGVWPAQRIRQVAEVGRIRAETPFDIDQIQPASLDLRLSAQAYEVPASFLPGRGRSMADRLHSMNAKRIDISGGAELKTGSIYIVRLQETVDLRRRESGFANPKSSTGRLDIFARLITDFGIQFDTVEEGYTGPLWLEIAPRSFNVIVRPGSRLAQLRFRTGTPNIGSRAVRELNETYGVILPEAGEAIVRDGAIALSVDVMGNPDTGIVGYKSRTTDQPIDVDQKGAYDPSDFWETLYRPSGGGLILERDHFHILATKETVAIPDGWAADMFAYDTLVGEFRVHYAGFFDPGFGYIGNKRIGAKIVLEVRSHEVPFMVDDGQVAGFVAIERLTSATDLLYGQ
ncbi:MAG: 2'-deoxycytidine 5'-triphosphate deaminase, partial [Rhodospirillales bacterium]